MNKFFNILQVPECICKIKKIPFDLIQDHEQQAITNHGQSLERLNIRGGLSPLEIYLIVNKKPFSRKNLITAKEAAQWLEEWVENKS